MARLASLHDELNEPVVRVTHDGQREQLSLWHKAYPVNLDFWLMVVLDVLPL